MLVVEECIYILTTLCVASIQYIRSGSSVYEVKPLSAQEDKPPLQIFLNSSKLLSLLCFKEKEEDKIFKASYLSLYFKAC